MKTPEVRAMDGLILCAGEALIDMLPRETEEGAVFLPAAGGAVLNTAVALGRLGAPVAFHSGLSTDIFGQRLAAALAESGVEDRTAKSDRPTTLAFVTLVDGHARYAFYDEGTAGRMLRPADAPSLDGVGALFLGGISLAVEPCAATFEALAAAAPQLPMMLDPNVRPGFIRDPDRFRARMERLLARADIVKLSDEDMGWLGVTPEEVLAMGPRIVCVTEGAEGVTAHLDGRRVRVPAPRVAVVDTVGAGDTFNAGLLAGLHRAGALAREPGEAELRAALELGVRAAAAVVQRAGADPPWADEL
jgi:fructokinase